MTDSESLRGLELRSDYATSSDDLMDDFYVPCLSRSHRYDRLAGFFSSAVVALAPLAFADFFRRGGLARLVCSPRLSPRDYEAFSNPADLTESMRERAVADLEDLAGQGPQAEVLVRAMSSMIRSGVLQVKIAVPRSPHGLFHDKTGVFLDPKGNRVSFVGSTNESAAAWSGLVNHEQIEVFASWESEDSSTRSRRHARVFEETWLNARRGLRVLEPADAAHLISSVSPPEDLDGALEAVRMLRASARRSAATGKAQKDLLPHQSAVLRAWSENDHRGLVAFATGAGKTLTGITAMKEWGSSGRPTIALVPSELLQQQWAEEIRAEYPEVQLLKAGGDANRNRWSQMAADWTSDNEGLGPRCLLATYQTARTSDFLQRVQSGPHLLLLADEVHRMGAPDTRALFEQLDAGARLGLSATPDRYGDPLGTQAIYDYFGSILQPRYTLEDAIRDGRLVPYAYRFETCSLTDDEQEEYDDLTRRIKQAAARERVASSQGEVSEYLSGLLRRRSRILKHASNKAGLARRVLSEHYRPGQRWLVYCESVAHLREVRSALADCGLPLLEYHQAMPGDKTSTLDYFSTESGVLLAIKCLDEGVDIPATDHALILASTTNPREYIQRRGRVLRTAPSKFNAVIVDALVVDPLGKALAQSELRRSAQFAAGSENRGVKFDLAHLASDQHDWTKIWESQETERNDDGD